MAEKPTRIATVNHDRCKPKKCHQECKKSCPVVRMGLKSLCTGMRRFLEPLGTSFRRDPKNSRRRINKPNSNKDKRGQERRRSRETSDAAELHHFSGMTSWRRVPRGWRGVGWARRAPIRAELGHAGPWRLPRLGDVALNLNRQQVRTL
ncbi:unnamed protein product [Tetraodon nigroviridis]|uniref:(spotted green pufferfish) hypothetical protein n=1 Tax=Tetraodon nigroviridis TaxID=99883 RepID=Q4STC4_TETNG|nr:unnamed protein product [Tetraodon nigroviridis]